MSKINEILKMVKDEIISIEEAEKLINALEEKPLIATKNELIDSDYQQRMLRVLVKAIDGDIVRVNIPVVLILAGIDIAHKFNNLKFNDHNFDMGQIDFELIKQCIQSKMMGEIVSVEAANGDTIKIFIE